MNNFNKFYNNTTNYFGDAPSDGLVKMFKEYNVPIGKALDIGAGEGRNSFYLDKIGFKVSSIEPDKFGVNKILKNKGIEVFETGIIEFDDTDKIDNYDFILAGTSLDQLPQEQILIATSKIIKMLKPGGYSYILVFTEDDPEASECSDTIGHYFYKGELKSLFTDPNIEILFYDEYMKIDESHGPTHYHGKAKIIFKKIKA